MNITDHFTYEEMWASKTAQVKRINNLPTPEAAANFAILCCNVLEPARVAYGGPINVTSGYRCPRLNTAAGGKPNSQHLQGRAADLTCADMGRLFSILSAMDVDQLLYEYDSKGNRWIHVSYNAEGNRNHVDDHYKSNK